MILRVKCINNENDYFDLFTSHGELCHWLYGKWHIILEMTIKIMRFVYFRWQNASKTEYLSVGEGGRSSPWRFFSISRTMSWFSVLMCNLCIWTLTSLTSSWLKSYHGIYVLLYTWTLFPADSVLEAFFCLNCNRLIIG
jgi:hypothetical protein